MTHSIFVSLTRTRLVLLGFLALCFGLQSLQAADKPNVLFLFADDQCFETISAFGHTDIETPNLDRLAKRGTVFTHAYNMGSWSGAVCVASRNMLNTGRFLWAANKASKVNDKERQAGRFWSEHMKKAGYETYFTGKWHVKADATKAFHHSGHVRPGMPNQTAQGYNRPIEGKEDVWSPYDKKFEGFWKGGKHWSEIVGDDGVSYLQNAAKEDKPFFMYLAFNAPHDPRQSPKEYVDKYPLDRIALPKNYMPVYRPTQGFTPKFDEASAKEIYDNLNKMGCGRGLRDEKLAPFPRTEFAVKVNRQEYYAIITHMDEQIGRILDALEKSGKADNTYIFFSADHGLAVGRHGLLGKQNLYDHSTRVPFIVVGPKAKAGVKDNRPVYLQDIMATSLELAGIDKPSHVQFNSILPLLADKAKETYYPAVYGAYLDVQRSVTKDDYKLILYPKLKTVKLFNLKDDPLEIKNLAADQSQQGRIKDLFSSLLALQKTMEDPLNLKSIYTDL